MIHVGNLIDRVSIYVCDRLLNCKRYLPETDKVTLQRAADNRRATQERVSRLNIKSSSRRSSTYSKISTWFSQFNIFGIRKLYIFIKRVPNYDRVQVKWDNRGTDWDKTRRDGVYTEQVK